MAATASGVDLAIVGAGSAAFAAAIRAREAGRSVVMVERGTVGGTCVNVGCVPSKALLAAAAARHTAGSAGRFPGIEAAAGPVRQGELIAGKDVLVAQLRADKYVDLAAEYGFEILSGTAVFTDGPALTVTRPAGEVLRVDAAHYLVATGSTPWVPVIDGLAEAGYLTSATAMQLRELPDSLLVVGANAVGLELAQLFARLGTQVTLVETLQRVAPYEEPEVSAALRRVLLEDGIVVHTGATLSAVRRPDSTDYVAAVRTPVGALEVKAQQLLMATGRRPVTDGLNLDRVGVRTGPRGEIMVDEFQRTSTARIWAAGDVTGSPQYVYVAAAQGKLAAANAFGTSLGAIDYAALPRVTFTDPAIAAVGLTEAQAQAAGHRCACRVLSLEQVPRALVNRDTRGLVKLVAEADTGQLLGAHVLAEQAGEIITTASYAITAELTIERIAGAWHPYLTIAEALKLAAQAFTTDVTKLSCCAG